MIKVDNFIVEVTKDCNARCRHCLRGCAQNQHISTDLIEKLAAEIQPNAITFTGGEPFLAYKQIMAYYEKRRELDLSLPRFFIVTNGLIWNQEFINFLTQVEIDKKLEEVEFRHDKNETITDKESLNNIISACEYNEESSSLAVSVDEYHTPAVSVENYIKFQYLPFYSHEKESFDRRPMKIGKGVNVGGDMNDYEPSLSRFEIDFNHFEYDDNEPFDSNLMDDYLINELYISSEGYVSTYCDASFDTVKDFINLGNIYDTELNEIIRPNNNCGKLEIERRLEKCETIDDYVQLFNLMFNEYEVYSDWSYEELVEELKCAYHYVNDITLKSIYKLAEWHFISEFKEK